MNLFKLLFKKNKTEEKQTKVSLNSEINPEWDEVFNAWTSNDLSKMLKVTNVSTTLTNRHFLLQSIVNESYKKRSEIEFRDICLKYSEVHLLEFDEISKVLKDEIDQTLPRVTTFQNYATLLTELGEFEKAIIICEKAILYNLDDGTKSNYQGRIDRIRKKQTK